MTTKYGKMIAFAIGLFFILAVLLGASNASSGTVISVDDDGGANYTSIQQAVDNATGGETILVYPGIYTENVDVDKELTIISQSGNPDDTIVQADDSNDHVFNVTRDNVTISGFNITGATGIETAGILLAGVQNNTVNYNKLSNNFGGIVLFRFSDNNTLSNNEASNNNGGIVLLNSSNNNLSNNTASENYWDGIYLESSSNNTLNGNIANSNEDDGINLLESNNNKLSNNTASENYWDGIYLESSSNNTLNGNIANSNDDDGINLWESNNNKLSNSTASENYWDGIYLESSSNNTLNGNIANSNEDDGINLLESNNNKLSNNTASENYWYGIYLESSSNNTLNDNIANSNDDSGIVLRYSNSNTLNSKATNSNNKSDIRLEISSNNMMSDSTLNSNGDDSIDLWISGNNTLTDNTANSNSWDGISLWYSNNNTLNDNIVSDNDYGVYLLYSNNNLIYNNHFNNTNNVLFEGNNTGNVWNTTKTSGTNIVGGPYIGGNFWAEPDGTGFSQTCNDTDSDGICDLPYTIGENNTDYLPLSSEITVAKPVITLFDPSSPSVSDNVGDSRTFTVNVNQIANVTWMLDGVTLYTNVSVQTASYHNSSAEVGVHNLTVIAQNENGTDQKEWIWTVISKDIHLYQGWNFISVPYELKNSSVDSVLADVDYEDLSYYNTQTDTWENVSTIEPLKGYWIFVSEDSLIPLKVLDPKLPVLPQKLQLYEGWNSIGYTDSMQPLSAELTLRSIDDSYLTILGPWNPVTLSFEYVGHNDETGIISGKHVGTDVFEMESYKGYWIYVTDECTLSVTGF